MPANSPGGAAIPSSMTPTCWRRCWRSPRAWCSRCCRRSGLNVTAPGAGGRARARPVPQTGRRRRGAVASAASSSGCSTARRPTPRSWATPTSRPSTSCWRWPRRRARPSRALLSARALSADDLAHGAGGGARLAPGHRPVARGEVPGAGALHPEPHRGGAQRESWIRSSAGTRRSAASCRCCPAAPRTTRC